MRRLALIPRRLLLGAIAAWTIPVGVAAQRGCQYAEGTEELNSIAAPGGDRITYIRRPHFACDDGVEIWADSAVAYSAQAMSILIGSVRYLDRARELRADQARYFSQVGRLQAQGRLHVTNSDDGSVIENGDLVYLREADYRAEEEMVVTTGRDGLRPRAMLRPEAPDSVAAGAEPPSPYTVVADRIVLRGAGYFNATGTVEIERDSLLAFADSAEYEETSDLLVLVGTARVESAAYELVGRTITLGTAGSGTNEIRARRDAVLTGEDLRLTAPLIVLHLTDGAIERLVAVPLAEPDSAVAEAEDLARPVAVAEGFELTADSLELTSPAEVVERIFAAGRARSVSHARDSLNVDVLPELAQYDWLEGDTIVVMLRPTTDPLAADSAAAGAYEVERIVARVGARSLYRLPAEDSTAVAGVDPPAVHYVMGDTITIVMNDEGEVEVMEVVGQTRGVHFEPLRPGGTDAPADSSAAPSPDFSTMTQNDRRAPVTDPAAPRPRGAPPPAGGQPWIRP